MTNHLLQYYTDRKNKILDLINSIKEELGDDELYSMFEVLKCFKTYFKLVESIDKSLLPTQETLIQFNHFYRTTEELENLSRQEKQIGKYESDIGIDLTFLRSYIDELYDQSKSAFMEHISRVDKKQLDKYEEKLYNEKKDNGLRLKQIIRYTKKKIKKVEKDLEKKPTAGRFQELKNNIEEIFVLFDIINTEKELEEILYTKLLKRSSYIYNWYNRVISYEIVKKYQQDYPVKAEKSYGSIEILKDYLVKKIYMKKVQMEN